MSTWHTIVSFTDRISSGVWVGLMLANTALTITTRGLVWSEWRVMASIWSASCGWA